MRQKRLAVHLNTTRFIIPCAILCSPFTDGWARCVTNSLSAGKSYTFWNRSNYKGSRCAGTMIPKANTRNAPRLPFRLAFVQSRDRGRSPVDNDNERHLNLSRWHSEPAAKNLSQSTMMNRSFFIIWLKSLLKRVIISITLLCITRILGNFDWGFSFAAAFFAPFLKDLLDFVLSAMDRIPLSVGDDPSGASSSKQPSFDLNRPGIEQAVYEQLLEEIKNQKQRLADLIDPLIKKEAQKYPDIKKLPSPTDVVEELIRRIGSNKAREENDHNAPAFRNLKTWLTRACQNAEDETKGRMSIRSSI